MKISLFLCTLFLPFFSPEHKDANGATKQPFCSELQTNMCRKMEKFSYFHDEKNKWKCVFESGERREKFHFSQKFFECVCVCDAMEGLWSQKLVFWKTFYSYIEQREWKTRTRREWNFFISFSEILLLNEGWQGKFEVFLHRKLTEIHSFTIHATFHSEIQIEKTFKIVSFILSLFKCFFFVAPTARLNHDSATKYFQPMCKKKVVLLVFVISGNGNLRAFRETNCVSWKKWCFKEEIQVWKIDKRDENVI